MRIDHHLATMICICLLFLSCAVAVVSFGISFFNLISHRPTPTWLITGFAAVIAGLFLMYILVWNESSPVFILRDWDDGH